MEETQNLQKTKKKQQSLGDTESEIESYQISPSSQHKGEVSFSDDEDDHLSSGSPHDLAAGESIFGFQGSKFESTDLTHLELSSSQHTQQQTQQQSQTQKSFLSPVNPLEIISEIQIESSLFSNNVVTKSLEMMWFVMVAAEDIRPKKIMIRNYVKDILINGVNKIQILKDIAQEFVMNCLWEGYYQASDRIISSHQKIAIENTSQLYVNRSLQIAQDLILNSYLQTTQKYQKMKQILIHEMTNNFITNLLISQVKISSIRHVISSFYVQNVLETSRNNYYNNLQPVMCSYQRFHEIIEENILGSIGAAVYTIDMKVIPTRNSMKNHDFCNDSTDGTDGTSAVVRGALPVGTGFALAKAKKTAKDMIELEILNLQTKEIITHLYHTENGDYASIQDAISDATQNLDGMNPFVFEELTMCYQSDMVINGRTYNIKLLKDERNYRMLIELFDIRMKSTLKIQLTKKQEKEIEYVRNIVDYLHQLFQETNQFLGFYNLHEAMIQKSGENILIGKDIIFKKTSTRSSSSSSSSMLRNEVEVLLQIDEININYQPYNIKVTEDEMGIRIEVWNLKVGKVVGTRLTKRQERDFHEVHDRQQFLVSLLGTPGFAFLL
jgi:hypothetical protein